MRGRRHQPVRPLAGLRAADLRAHQPGPGHLGRDDRRPAELDQRLPRQGLPPPGPPAEQAGKGMAGQKVRPAGAAQHAVVPVPDAGGGPAGKRAGGSRKEEGGQGPASRAEGRGPKSRRRNGQGHNRRDPRRTRRITE